MATNRLSDRLVLGEQARADRHRHRQHLGIAAAGPAGQGELQRAGWTGRRERSRRVMITATEATASMIR